MTIRRGADWGELTGPAPGTPVVNSDAELRAVLEEARRGADGPHRGRPEVGLRGGDLHRTLGGRRGPAAGAPAGGATSPVRLELDAGRASLDGHDHWFTAHLVARRRLWRGRFVVAMNAQWLGRWRAGPRAHPGDGLLDITDGALAWRQRWVARSRAVHGEHLPHPALTVVRVAEWATTFERPTPVWLDGVRVGPCRSLRLTVEPDAVVVVLLG